MDKGDMGKMTMLMEGIKEAERSQVAARNKFVALLHEFGFIFRNITDNPSLLRLRLPYPVTGWLHNWHSFVEITISDCYLKNDNVKLGEFRVEIFNVFKTPDCNHGYDGYGGNRIDEGRTATDKDVALAIEMALKERLESAKREEEKNWLFVKAFQTLKS